MVVDNQTAITAAVTLATAVLTAWIPFRKWVIKTQAELARQARRDAIDEWVKIAEREGKERVKLEEKFEATEKRLVELTKRVDECEEDREDLRKENAELHAEINRNRAEIGKVRVIVTRLKAQLERLKKPATHP